MFENKDCSKGSLMDFLEYTLQRALGKVVFMQLLELANDYHRYIHHREEVDYNALYTKQKTFWDNNYTNIKGWFDNIYRFLGLMGFKSHVHSFDAPEVQIHEFSVAWTYELFHEVLQVLKRNRSITDYYVHMYNQNNYSLPL